MPKKQESLNLELERLLKRFRPVKRNSAGKTVPVSDQADVFQFPFVVDGENYGTVTVSIDGLKQLVVYYSDETAESPNYSENGDITFTKLKLILKNFALDNQLGFRLDDVDNLESDMAKREHTKKLDESYHSMGKKASYSDNIPTCKIILKHSKVMGEGEQRFRHVERIFIETSLGERFLAPTTKPGVAQVYARHLVEGGRPGDDRWNHITGLVEEYTKMAGFVRATRGNQFNESTQKLVNEGVNHYLHLRESLSKMRGKKGYTNYFENWSPALMENEEQVDLSEMFVTNTLDPRIENALPFLGKLSKNLQESSSIEEVDMFEEWVSDVVESSLIPKTAAQQDELFNVLNKEKLPFGPDASNVKNELSSLIHDDDLFNELEKKSKIDSNADAKEAVINYLSSKPEYKATIDKLNKKIQQPEAPQEPVAENKDEEADYGFEYQDTVERVGKKAKEQEKKKPVDIQDLAKRLHAVLASDEKQIKEAGPAGEEGDYFDATQTVSTGPILGNEPQTQKGLRGKLVGESELLAIKKLSGI